MAGSEATKVHPEASIYSNNTGGLDIAHTMEDTAADGTSSTGLRAIQARVSTLEAALPALEQQMALQRASLQSQEFTASLAALKSATDALAQQHAYCGMSSALRSLGWQLWLGAVAAASHAQQLLSGADVAALLLSRRLLLQRDPFEPADRDYRLLGRRSLLGGAFFLAAVEATWQIQGWLGPKLPKRAQRASEGIARAVRLLRIACWASAFILTTSAARQACFAVADQVAGLQPAAQVWAQQQTQPLLPPSAPPLQVQAGSQSSENDAVSPEIPPAGDISKGQT